MSEIRATTISNAAGTGPITMTGQYAAKAWVNFNGTSTVAIRQGGNVSSIVDNGTGSYTVNFTTAMVDANYVLGGTAMYPTAQNAHIVTLGDNSGASGTLPTVSACKITTFYVSNAGALQDCEYVTVTFTR